MKKVILALIAALTVASCTQEQLDADMAKAKAVLASIRQGAAVTASGIRQGIDAVCANQPAVYTSAMATRSILLQQIGPNSTRNIDNLDKALAAFNNVCAAASNPNATNLTTLLSAAISAYNSVKAAQNPAGA